MILSLFALRIIFARPKNKDVRSECLWVANHHAIWCQTSFHLLDYRRVCIHNTSLWERSLGSCKSYCREAENACFELWEIWEVGKYFEYLCYQLWIEIMCLQYIEYYAITSHFKYFNVLSKNKTFILLPVYIFR